MNDISFVIITSFIAERVADFVIDTIILYNSKTINGTCSCFNPLHTVLYPKNSPETNDAASR